MLEGAKSLILRDKPIIYTELWENENRKKCIQLLERMEYKSFIFVDHKMLPYNETKGAGQNFIFLPVEFNINKE